VKKRRKERVNKIVRKSEIKRCYFCGSTENITEHHIIFRFCGGEGLENNKEYLCEICHQKLHALVQPMINLLLKTIQDLQPKPTRKIGFVHTNGKKVKVLKNKYHTEKSQEEVK